MSSVPSFTSKELLFNLVGRFFVVLLIAGYSVALAEDSKAASESTITLKLIEKQSMSTYYKRLFTRYIEASKNCSELSSFYGCPQFFVQRTSRQHQYALVDFGESQGGIDRGLHFIRINKGTVNRSVATVPHPGEDLRANQECNQCVYKLGLSEKGLLRTINAEIEGAGSGFNYEGRFVKRKVVVTKCYTFAEATDELSRCVLFDGRKIDPPK